MTAPVHLRDRVAALRKRLREGDADALLVTNPRDIRYLTGFVGDDSWALIPQRGGQVYILSDFRFDEQIQREAPHAKAIMRKKSLTDELAKLLDDRKVEQVGLQPNYVTLAHRKAIVKKLGAKRVVEFDDGLLKQRAVKTADEIKIIRKAIRIQQDAFNDLLESGMLETDREQAIAAYLEYRMRAEYGADGCSFPTIVAADANAALPHAVPGKKRPRQGSIVLIDWGARYDGYCSDLTRVVALGKMKPKLREIYQVVLDAQLAAIDAIEPGRALKDIDAVARKVISDAGYGEQFGHSLGHGIGLDIHEQPTLSPRSEGVLEAGQVVTVEPGIYLPGVGGVRIEDDVLVTGRGAKVLSDLPKRLESAII
ncbi:M24 family metallopeptidase [Phycisphaerales bacterium AB-hyl4]|uniref:M24 family metallopeptidase n=1 Tax=Natronomicrosphaera hydrolytica TaxID=3242702 RepID=A0ABV4U522_9BACT